MLRLEDQEGRFHRQELISWWDQERLTSARVLVVGAGALGNEIVKNLILVGVGQIEVCDMDTIANSNLSRCVFFRSTDLGQHKSEVLARRARELYDAVEVVPHTVPIQRLGVGYLNKFDIVLGALDNREARAWVNQACRKLGLYWLDGAIEGLRGLARMFGPEGACYECTLSENDYKQMSHRKSCALLAPQDILEGKTPTNASTASIIAAVQVQEAIKYLNGKIESLSLLSRAWMFTGDFMDTFISNYKEDVDCLAHDRYPELQDSPDKDLSELLLGFESQDVIAIDFEEEIIHLLPCENCGKGDELLALRSSLAPGRGRCECGSDYPGTMFSTVEPESLVTNIPFSDLGLALKDIVTIRTTNNRHHFTVNGKR